MPGCHVRMNTRFRRLDTEKINNMASSGIDTVTKRPRTPNDQYTVLTDHQVQNINKQTSPFFHTIRRTQSQTDKEPREGGRFYLDRYCNLTSEHLIRGKTKTQPYDWIDSKWSRHPPAEYDTCRGRASVRWGANKAGERTRSHFFGESVDRYTTIDMYRRNPTNYAGRVVMDCGRPADGYYAQKYPASTTWFGSSVPLNQTQVMGSVYRKSAADYEQIKAAELLARRDRAGYWPEYTEYTDKYLMSTKTQPRTTGLQEKKNHVMSACV